MREFGHGLRTLGGRPLYLAGQTPLAQTARAAARRRMRRLAARRRAMRIARRRWYATGLWPRVGRWSAAPFRWTGSHLSQWWRRQVRIRLRAWRIASPLARLFRQLGWRHAIAALLVAAASASIRFLKQFKPYVVPTEPAPTGRHHTRPARPPAPTGRQPVGVSPGTVAARPRTNPADQHDSTTDSDNPTPVTAPARTRPAAAPAPAGRGTTMAVDTAIPSVHPAQAKYLTGSLTYVAKYSPLSPPDLYQYLNSQPDAMRQTGSAYTQLGNRLAATFPGITLVHSYFSQVGNGFAALAGKAVGVKQGFEAEHAEDLARFRAPRVNEHYADVRPLGVQVASVPVLQDGQTRMHAYHVVMLEMARRYITGWYPGVEGVSDDRVRDLMEWLADLPLFMDCLGRHQIAFATHLVTHFPIERDMIDYYKSLARGYLDLADQAYELCDKYVHRNAPDVRRRVQPRPNEAWFDFSNQAVRA
jgi:hypothetical protein